MKRRQKCYCGHWKKLRGNEYICPNCKAVTSRLRDSFYDYDNYDWCYECKGYGDDYYYDRETGELVSACDDCPHSNYDPWDE